LVDSSLWIIAIVAAVGELLGVTFWLTLPLAGVAYVVAAQRRWGWVVGLFAIFAAVTWQTSPVLAGHERVFPAPLIIFSTFVGFFGGGALGALAMTLGIFLPAFSFALLFHKNLEVVIANPVLRHFLEGVTAGVVGLIAVTAVSLALVGIPNWRALAIFAVALATVIRWKGKASVPALVLAAGLAGWTVM
jgi:hypothetical protein